MSVFAVGRGISPVTLPYRYFGISIAGIYSRPGSTAYFVSPYVTLDASPIINCKSHLEGLNRNSVAPCISRTASDLGIPIVSRLPPARWYNVLTGGLRFRMDSTPFTTESAAYS